MVFVRAGIYSFASIADISDVRTSNVFRVCAVWREVAVALVAVAELAGWSGAVVEVLSAVEISVSWSSQKLTRGFTYHQPPIEQLNLC